ncbi:hypothetical protein JHK84_043016 [Glycine max]|nr:hypothetical protein JHK84_043016 [Glycine max]
MGNGMTKSLLDSVGDPCTVPNVVLAIIRGGNFRTAESGEHAAADGSTMSLAKLGVLLLLLPLLILIAAGIGGDRRRRKASRTAGLRVGFRVGVRIMLDA